MFGDGVVTEHRYIVDIIDGIRADGLEKPLPGIVSMNNGAATGKGNLRIITIRERHEDDFWGDDKVWAA
jgi:hypothetical protein